MQNPKNNIADYNTYCTKYKLDALNPATKTAYDTYVKNRKEAELHDRRSNAGKNSESLFG